MWHLFLFFFWISTRMRSNHSWSYIWIFCVNSLDFIKVESKYQFQKKPQIWNTKIFTCLTWPFILYSLTNHYLLTNISVFPITEHNYKNWEQFFVDFFVLWYFRLCGTCTYLLVKFIYSEKATKFCKISTVDFTVLHRTNLWLRFRKKFVAFSECMN